LCTATASCKIILYISITTERDRDTCTIKLYYTILLWVIYNINCDRNTKLRSYKNVLSIRDNMPKYTYNNYKPISEMYFRVSTNTCMFTSTAIYGNTIGCVNQNNVLIVRFMCNYYNHRTIIITYEFWFFFINFEIWIDLPTISIALSRCTGWLRRLAQSMTSERPNDSSA